MKKALIILLSALMLISLTACGGDESDKKAPIGTDVEYYVKIGKIPEIEYALGHDADEIKTKLEESHKDAVEGTDDLYEHDHTGENYIGTYDNGKVTIIATTGINYYYESDKKAEGISRIVSLKGGYGFETGALIIEIKEAMESYGHKSEERKITQSEAENNGLTADMTCLEYTFDKNKVMFVFSENALGAIILLKA